MGGFINAWEGRGGGGRLVRANPKPETLQSLLWAHKKLLDLEYELDIKKVIQGGNPGHILQTYPLV